MEAVPRLPMLSFELRASVDKVDFSSKLKQYIKNHYNEDPTLYASGITGIESMRREAVCPSKSISGCSLLKRYYCQLHFMANRFPMRDNEEASVTFSWKSLHSNSTITLNDISLEMASILYNIGALHSQLGAMDNRTTSEGMKMSCTHFQCAAWAFQHIVEEFPHSKSLGFSRVLLSFLYYLCLAQAQECILEKSMMDNRKSGITAKVAVQVVDYYKHSLKLLNDWPKDENNPSDITGLKVFKKWDKYIQFKIPYYESILLLFQGQQSDDQQKMGERVAFYQAAFAKLEEARKLPCGIENTDNISEALTFVFDIIEVKRRAAKNENEFIYHEDVPSMSYLPKIKGASLVKGISFSINDPEVCGPDLFSSIIPMKAHEYASLYSEEKAKLLRKINELIENKDEELETFLSMLDLDEFSSEICGSKLPQELVDKCAALSARPDAVQNLKDAMAKLSDIYHDVEVMLNEIKDLLKEEENREKEYQLMVGKRPPSIAATDLTREAKKYQEAHTKASESNQTLHKAMFMHISNLKLLSLPLKELINQIPAITETPDVALVTNEMRHLISKVEEMKQQRLMLAGQLKDMVCQDDITSKIITHTGDKIEELFEQELKKYDKTVSLIEQNLAAQENILKVMKETYTKYGSTRKSTGESQRKRMAVISSLIASYDAYEDLVSKSSKGLDFYKKLETNVSKLLQRVKGTCKVQDEEREQLLKNVKKPDFSLPQSEAPPSNTLKLKEYLNLKKETGKLTLEHGSNVPPTSSYFNESKLPHQNWMPGVRPAPVGSEETDSNIKNASDTFRGFYQGQGKDQVWSNNFYSLPQNADQKLKYYLPQNATLYQTFSQNPSQMQGPDLYPISSYSSVMPKTEGQSYEPKSNYYDIQGSPNRIFNPVQSFKEPLSSSSGSSISYTAHEVGYASSVASSIINPNLQTPSQYGYPMQVAENLALAPHNSTPQSTTPSYVPTNETSVSTYNFSSQNQAVNQSQISSVYNPAAFNQTPQSYCSDSNQIQYGSSAGNYYSTPASVDYNTYSASQSKVYSSSRDQISASNASTYPVNYQPPLSQAPMSGTSYVASQEQVQPYRNIQNFPNSVTIPSSNNQNSCYVTCVQTYSTDLANPSSYYSSETLDSGAAQSWQTYMTTFPNQQFFQSGNESLYTASQTPSRYTMINSDLYKGNDSQNLKYTVNPIDGNQYYTNQYGGYGGQADFNAQSGNPVTYMQAGTDNQQAVTTTTFSNSEAKSSPAYNPSNVDLLAGLDFNINHKPLEPETPIITKKEETNKDVSVKETSVKNLPVCSQNTFNLSKESNEEKIPPKDWVTNIESVTHFAQEVEKYEKFVEGLTLKTLNGPTSLDLKWKEIVDHQEKISSQHIISVARCYPMKNRFSDILPYDDSRIELPSTKDDYINASKMLDLTELTPPFILTQAPLPSTYSDFWAMVFEQQVEIIICLLKDSELDGHMYWPTEKGQELEMGKLKISLQSGNVRSHWVERILSVCLKDTRMTRVVVHLQFTAWPGSSFPESPGPLLSFSSECVNFFDQQRSYSHPVVVHCTSGVGRTGLFCLLIASLLDIQAGKGIPDLAALAGRMCEFRKSCLRDREHLKFAYQAVLYYCQDFLMKRGILTTRSSFEDKKSKAGKCHTRHPSEDFLVHFATENDKLQAGFEGLEIDSQKKKQEAERKTALEVRSQSVCSSVSHTSSGRSSPSSLPADIMSTLDSANFSLKVDQNLKKKRFKPENFNKSSAMESVSLSNEDPLSQLDPLWTIKK